MLDLNPADADPAPLRGRGERRRPTRRSTPAIAAVAEKFGRIDIVVNNAGIGAQGTIADNDDDEWARVFSINVTGIARVTGAALPWLRKSPVGGDRQHLLDRGDRRPPRSGRSTARRRVPCCRSPARWPPTTCARASASTR